MLEYLYLARWDQALGFLASGWPPVWARLLALNALFLALYAVRRMAGAGPMPSGLAFFVQLTVVAANLLLIYQTEVVDYLRVFTNRP